jgi:hypothetical protein
MKKPVISWVSERKDVRGNGDGRIKSDWAFVIETTSEDDRRIKAIEKYLSVGLV